MRSILLSLVTSLPFLGAPALADLASFEKAFTGICLETLPDFKAAPDRFKSDNWQAYESAHAGEWEFYKDGTEVFLATEAPGLQAGCTVRDAAPARLTALWIMELWLDKHHEGNWMKGKDDYGPFWRLLLPEGMVVFRLADDPNNEGGASVSFEVRR